MLIATTEFPQSQAIADYLLAESRERGELLTPLKLQKLLFYSDAWHMALYDQEATNERFQAWVHGPVALSQYHRFKDFRWRPITEEIDRPELEGRMAQHLNEIIDVFGSESATALEIMTHQEAPWQAARGGIPDNEPCNNYIDKGLTRDFYGALAQENSEG
ncbi:Panacea domain-containing protein [Pseudooceanicola sp. MF1-13]|uniref:Panacea domain-containing protein n=1 Tax=Pseudooceanicola sp. MF1-13 TaxID=3379095 RepID=UPI00389165F8